MKDFIKIDELDEKLVKNILNEVYKDLNIERRDYQENIIVKTILYFEKYDKNHVLIESPTGSGKTIMALTLARYFQKKYGYKVGWSTMRKNLLSQTEEMQQKGNFETKINYMSIFEKNPEECDLLINDEAHRAVCPSGLAQYNKIKPKKCIGITATPFRSDKASLLFDIVIRECNLRRLVKERYLASFNYFSIPSWTPEFVANLYMKEEKRWGQSLVFFHTEEQCYEFSKILNDNHISCDVVTSKTNKEQQIEDFKNKKIKVLVNMLILTEGFDYAELETVFIKNSQKGITIQMGGRVLRKNNEQIKNIVQDNHTNYPFYRLAEPKREFSLEHNGEWKELTMNPHLAQIIKKAVRLKSQKSFQVAKKRKKKEKIA